MDPHTGRVIAVVNPGTARRARLPALLGLQDRGGHRRPDRGRDHARDHATTATGGCWMWPGHGPIDLRRALAAVLQPVLRVGGRAARLRAGSSATRSCWAWATPSGINLAGRDAPGACRSSCGPARVGHLSSHAAGHHHLRRAARRAALRDHQRRHRLPAAGQRGPRASRRASAGGCRADRAGAAWPTASWARSTRAAPPSAFDPDVDRGRQDRHLRRRGLVRVLRAGRPARDRDRGVRAARHRPPGLDAWPGGSTRTSTRPARRRHGGGATLAAPPAQRPPSAATLLVERSRSARRSVVSARAGPRSRAPPCGSPGRTTSTRWRPGGSSGDRPSSRAVPRNSPST